MHVKIDWRLLFISYMQAKFSDILHDTAKEETKQFLIV